MTKDQLLSKLDFLENRLKKLAEVHNSLKMENISLKKENLDHKLRIEGLEQNIKNFQNQEKISKIALSVADDTHDKTELKLKINEYIKEIDRCIAHLSEQ